MAASDYEPILFKNCLHLAGRPQMGSRPSTTLAECVCATVFQGFVFGNTGTVEAAAEG
jgi:hypothetical protein